MILSEETRQWLGDKIRQEYKTVRQFADVVGLTESAVSRILNGNRRMMAYHYSNFARALKMDEEDFKQKIGG